MKVNEIVREERLDEAGPLSVPIAALGGLTWGGILGAVSLFLTTISVIDLIKLLEKYNYDPAKLAGMTDEEWKDLFIILIMASVPGAGRFSKEVIRKMIPDRFLSGAAKRVKTQVTNKLNKSKTDPKRQERIKKVADAKFNKLASNVKIAFNTLGISSIVVTYYIKLEDLETQYEAAKSGDTTTEIFGNADQSELLSLADEQRKKLLGEATLSIAAVIGGLTGAKALKAMELMFGSSRGGRIVGGLLSIPARGAARLLEIGATAWPILLHTEAGQQFLSSNIIRFFSTTAGTLVAEGIDLLLQGLDEVAKRSGLGQNAVSGAVQSTISKDKQAQVSQTGTATANAVASKVPYQLRLEKDRQNPNILYIGGVQVTDKDGFQSIGNTYKQQLSREAKASNVPDPTVNLKPKPGVNYNY